MIKKIDHMVITTEDIKGCLEFYEKLGFEVKAGRGRYELFAGDFKINVHIFGQELIPHAEHVCPGSADLCFEIGGNLLSYQNELEGKGLKTEQGVVARNGVRGAMNSIYLRDPDGNLVEFCKYE